MADLREYQISSISDLRMSFVQRKKRVAMYLPTGAGKTVLAEAIIDMATSKGKRVAFICNRIELAAQTSRRFSEAGIRHGVLQGENTHSVHAPVMICSIQTLTKRKAYEFDLIIIDECHGVPGSRAYLKLIYAMSNVPVVGLTATPFSKGMGRRHDALGGPLFEDLVVGATIKDLIAAGYLVDVDIYAPDAFQPDLSSVKVVAGDYEQTELAEAVDKPKLIGDIVSHWKKLGRGKPTIVFATNIAHSKHIVEQFCRAGVKAEHVDYLATDEERTDILNRVRSGKTTIISNAAMLAEGLDIPQLEVMILARPTKSLVRYIQQAGRILRPYPGKQKALILDHSGTCAKLGFPTDDLPLELDDGKPKQAGEAKKHEKEPSVCTSCGYLKAPGVHECPSCGFAPQRRSDVVVEDGELKPLSRKDRLSLSMADKQAIYSALIGWVEAKGRSPGWAYHLYAEMMGANVSNMLAKDSGPMVESVAKWLQHRNIRYAKSKDKAGKGFCPHCKSTDFRVSSGVGPHAQRADCNACGKMWWLAKERA